MKISAYGGDSFLTKSDLVITHENKDPNRKNYKCYFLVGDCSDYAFSIDIWYRKEHDEQEKYMIFDGWSWVHVFDILDDIDYFDNCGNNVKIVYASVEMKKYFSKLSRASKQSNTMFLLDDILSA